MNRNSVLKILNPILGLLVVNQIVTGLLADTIPREAFEILHEGGGIALAVVALVHVVLNWNWIQANYRRKLPGTRA